LLCKIKAAILAAVINFKNKKKMSNLIKALPEGALQVKQDIAKYQQLLDTKPPQAWIKDHPMQSKVKYIPIQVHEELLRKIFQEYSIEIKTVQQLFHSVCITVRINYKHPVTGEWLFVDGVGAQNVQTDKGASASDLSKVKPNAVMLAAPAAESYAIKDACEKLGELFGGNLNRKDVISFNSPYEDKKEDNGLI
jgi:predicted DNA binding CopG/RHH family protein